MTRPALLVIGGPTAIGKTDFALRLAERLQGEVVNADSRQIYRGMDIGTAKPSLHDRRLVPHHMLDIVNPDEGFTLAQYLLGARAAIESVHRKGKLPILVGGTGLYLRAVSKGFDVPAVAPNPALRAELDACMRDGGIDTLVQRLRDLDPEVAARIDTRNPRRVIRALEVRIALGEPAPEARQVTQYSTTTIVLTMDRDRVFARAARRLRHMVEHGFIDEVAGLMAAGYSLELPAMSALGYREFGRYVLGQMDLETALAETEKQTRAYIRRQVTWFRGDRDALPLNVEQPEQVGFMERRITEWRETACP